MCRQSRALPAATRSPRRACKHSRHSTPFRAAPKSPPTNQGARRGIVMSGRPIAWVGLHSRSKNYPNGLLPITDMHTSAMSIHRQKNTFFPALYFCGGGIISAKKTLIVILYYSSNFDISDSMKN